jgi:hypothetical protein
LTAHRKAQNPLAPLYTAIALAGVGFAGMLGLSAAGDSTPAFASQQLSLPAAKPALASLATLQHGAQAPRGAKTLTPASGHTSAGLSAADVGSALLGQSPKTASTASSTDPSATSSSTTKAAGRGLAPASTTIVAAGTLAAPTTVSTASTTKPAGTGRQSVTGAGSAATPTAPAAPVATPSTRPIKPVTPVTRPTTPATVTPVTPTTPTRPATPAAPVTPVKPAAPVTPVTPVTPVAPAKPVVNPPAPVVVPTTNPGHSLPPIIQAIIDALKSHRHH